MNTLWKLPAETSQKYVGPGNKLLSLVEISEPVYCPVRHIRYFDKQTFEFIGEVEMDEINIKYLRKIFKLEDNDKLLLSYEITKKQKMYMEKLSGLNINLEKYDYFMEC